MALREDEVYKRAGPDCGCETPVTKGAAPRKGGDENPRCCCGPNSQKQPVDARANVSNNRVSSTGIKWK